MSKFEFREVIKKKFLVTCGTVFVSKYVAKYFVVKKGIKEGSDILEFELEKC